MSRILRFHPEWFIAGLIVVGAFSPAWGQDQPPTSAAKPAETKPTNPASAPVPSATVPAPRPGAWVKQHESFVERGTKGNVDLLFLGDSITAGWRGAPTVWSRYYAPRQAVNFGIGGDRTQHVLWRLENGEVAAIKPKVVVLMIGTNNLNSNTEAEVVDGVRAVVESLRSKLPDSKILLLGIFPRGNNRDKSIPDITPDARVARVNDQIAHLDDGKMIKFLEIGGSFLDKSGRVNRATMPDFVHLTPAAYQAWADAIEPTLWELMAAK